MATFIVRLRSLRCSRAERSGSTMRCGRTSANRCERCSESTSWGSLVRAQYRPSESPANWDNAFPGEAMRRDPVATLPSRLSPQMPVCALLFGYSTWQRLRVRSRSLPFGAGARKRGAQKRALSRCACRSRMRLGRQTRTPTSP
jgi:hypothetical protein